MPEPRLLSVSCHRELIPLKTSYRLSRTTVTDLDAVIAEINWSDGSETLGEVTPLAGYHRENAAEVLRLAQSVLSGLRGLTAEDARDTALVLQQRSRCAASLLLTALDNYEHIEKESAPLKAPIPLVAAVAAHDPDFESRVEKAAEDGFTTIKIKIGRSLNSDLTAARVLESLAPDNIKLRFDANQAYKSTEARRFADIAAKYLGDRVELLEQPLPPPEWAKTAILAHQTPIPIMLDESIETRADVRRASESGCKLIKLKLCKQGGVSETWRLAEYAHQLGLGVVLGNGVASDIVNLLELKLFANHRELFSGACEANGFAKLRRPLVHSELQVINGSACWVVASSQEVKRTREEVRHAG